MGWTDLQRRMLSEMGLPAWLAPAADPAPTEAGAQAPGSAATSIAVAAPGAPRRRVVHAEEASAEKPEVRTAAPTEHMPAALPVRPPAAVATLGWEQLQAAVAVCTACDLCHGRSRTVFGGGGRQPRWLVVGDAPRDKEDVAGEPFAGRSGPLLDNMLAALRLSRTGAPAAQQVFVTNALKCRLPGHRNPSAQEFAACEGHLLRQIELLEPAVIVVVGRYAAQSMLRSGEPVGRLRGRVHQYHGVPLVVTHDPAFLMRNPELKARAWDDLCLAAEAAEAAPARR